MLRSVWIKQFVIDILVVEDEQTLMLVAQGEKVHPVMVHPCLKRLLGSAI